MHDIDATKRIHDLELALKHERDRCTELQRRADALEEAARRAYRLAIGVTRRSEREDV